ncbi:hypothetical protein BGP75_21600 [Motiliproteus sp. MSK22-1]|nr:hypothetical protein BGP75_21600 [Motiliproteus sp. MSK22-1]
MPCFCAIRGLVNKAYALLYQNIFLISLNYMAKKRLAQAVLNTDQVLLMVVSLWLFQRYGQEKNPLPGDKP